MECEFIIRSTVKTVRVYSYFRNGPELGWEKSSIYEVGPKTPGG